MPSLQLKKRAPSLAFAAEATTNRRIAHNVKNAPFNLMRSPSFGEHPMKKWPHARLQALDLDKYDPMDIHYHVQCFEANGGIWVSGKVVK